MKYYPTIGLEIHAELKTETKMFCNSKNDPEEKRPNTNVCPVCMGHPGTLPTANKEAVKSVLKVGVSVGGEIADYSEFDRKNYFYPDIPKGYQISQYAFPLVKGGVLGGIALTRIHLEEDTAKSFHVEGDREHSLVDFNRAGVPLMELVTEPVIANAQEAVRFAKELQLLLRYLKVADANMEKGQMRVEANISVSTEKGKYGKKVEVKNLNSFRSVERAIQFELARQEKIIDGGGEVIQETRGWDEEVNETFSQRRKEESHDYRYFPDPDIPKLKLHEMSELLPDVLRKELPELPWQRRERLLTRFAIKKEDVELYVNDVTLGKFFEDVARCLLEDTHPRTSASGPRESALVQLASNYLASDLVGLAKESKASGRQVFDSGIRPEDFAELMSMIGKKEVSSRGAKNILRIMFEKGGSPRSIARDKSLFQESNEDALKAIVTQVLFENSKAVSEYKAGKQASLQHLIGQSMKAAKGSANPSVLKEIIVKLILD